MNTIRKILVAVIGFPIGIVLALCIGVSASLIWPIYIIGLLIDKLIKSFTKKEQNENNILNSIVEFIFACYGFAGLFLLLPLMLFEPNEVK